MLKINAYGTYIKGGAGKTGIVEEYDIENKIPKMEGNPTGTVKARYLSDWIKEEDRLRPTFIQTCYVEAEETDEKQMSFKGKDILKLEWEALQDFAVVYGLRGIPVKLSCSKNEARRKAVILYLEEVLGLNLKEMEEYNVDTQQLDWTKLKEIKVKADFKPKKEDLHKKKKVSILDKIEKDDSLEDETVVLSTGATVIK